MKIIMHQLIFIYNLKYTYLHVQSFLGPLLNPILPIVLTLVILDLVN